MRRTLLALALLVSAAPAKPFELKDVLSAPFPTELTVCSSSGSLAWVLNERGARNVWTAAAPDYRGARLTSYTADDGQDVGELRWTPDCRSVVYVRGGDLEFPGTADPNPASDPAGVEQAIWIASPGAAPRKIAEGHSPAVSPRGDRVAFIKAGQVWWAPLAGTAKPEQLIRARAGANAEELRWSPDGSKLAFVSARHDHSFVEVFDPAAKAVVYLDPSVDRDGSPAWSPDGKEIAFVRVPAAGAEPRFGPRRTGEPWSIRVARAADGAGRQVWKADAGRGSVFHGLASEPQIFWSGGRLVFPWERDGWLHLYAVSVEGGAARCLTPGAFEIEHAAPAEGGGALLYSSNQDDIDRRHIWRVSVEGGRPVRLTPGDGIEWAPVAAGQAVAFLRSGAREPARASVLTGGVVRDLAPDAMPSEFPAESLVVPQQVIFAAADGLPIHGQLFLPGGARGARHPAVVFMHGGSRRQMLLGWHSMLYYHNAYAMNQYLASRGFVVLSINYRSGIGYGLDFREAPGYGAAGASEFQDVQGAGLYLRGRPDVDPARIGLWGGSYGGYLTALGLARASDLFAVGVDFHGVHDWSALRSDPAHPDAVRTAFESSPMAAVKTWRSPVLLIHGDDDRNVPFSETVTLAAALRKQGVAFEELILPDEIHEFLRHGSWLRSYEAAADFLARKLKPAADGAAR